MPGRPSPRRHPAGTAASDGREAARRKDFQSAEVASVFETYPKEIGSKLMFLRQLIFGVASRTDGVGQVEETLRWGQPSYLTTQSGSGSMIRIDRIRNQEGKYAMFFHCQTTLVDSFREMFDGHFEFDGNRSIVFDVADQVPVRELSHCVSMALTYHLDKKRTLAKTGP